MPRKRKGFDLNGIILLNKPKGLSSNQALQKIKHLFHAAKAGHSGNLDPMATGMLPICFGRATKLCEYMLESNKTYIATIKLGSKTDTGDTEGQVIENKLTPLFSHNQLLSVLDDFTGELAQIPPMYSALKYQGKCLYELAREGKSIERKARNIRIDEIKLLDEISCQKQVLSLTLKISCSKGTYIRTLAEDIAEKLGTVAHLTALHRTECAGYRESEMKPLETFTGDISEILPATSALQDYPSIAICAQDVTALMQGKKIDISALLDDTFSHIKRLKLMHHNQLVAVADIADGQLLSRKIIG